MIDRASVRDAAFGGAHRLVWQSLQPQDPGKVGLRRHPLIDLKASDPPLRSRSDIVCEHALEMVPCREQIAQEILRGTDHTLADQTIVRVRPFRRNSMEPLS